MDTPHFSGLELMPTSMTDSERNGAFLMARVQAQEFMLLAIYLTHPAQSELLRMYDSMSATFSNFARTGCDAGAQPLVTAFAEYLKLFRNRLVLTSGEAKGVN